MSTSPTKCWICGESATTREHRTKRSDLRDVFGLPTQTEPLYFHNAKMKNRPIGSLNAKVLKSPSLICANCNNAHTQPHDRAWEQMSRFLRTRIQANALGAVVRANRIFKYDTAREMRNVHLYFVKIFGCHILEAAIPIDVATFSNAILNEKACPYVYLKFGRDPLLNDNAMTGMSDIESDLRASDGSCAFATWFYFLDGLAVNVMFAADGEKREGLIDAWHPRFGTNKLVVADFR